MKNSRENLKKLFDEILDKKFAKTKVSGYDPLEVDLFLDNVRLHIVNLNNYLKEYEILLRNKEQEISDLKTFIKDKDAQIIMLRNSVKSYEKDGYYNQKVVSELGQMWVEINELKNEKNK